MLFFTSVFQHLIVKFGDFLQGIVQACMKLVLESARQTTGANPPVRFILVVFDLRDLRR